MRKEVHTKQKILEAYYQGNDAPLAHFFEAIGSILLSRAQRKLKNLEWSKDVRQEVILNFLAHPKDIRPTKLKPNIENLVGFFIRVIECEAINALQRKINQDQHIQRMLEQLYQSIRPPYILAEDVIFYIFKEEDKRELFIQEVKMVLQQRAAKKRAMTIDVQVYEMMLLLQSRDIALQLNLPVEKVEVIKKRVRRVMRKVQATAFVEL